MPSFLSLKNQSRMKPLANMAESLSMGHIATFFGASF